MRHPSTGDDGHLFPASPDDFRNGPSQAGATLGRRQGRHIDVRVYRNDRDVSFSDQVFKRYGVGVAEHRIFGVRGIEALMNELAEKIFRHLGMDRQFVIPARKFRDRPFAADNGKSRNAVHGECFQVIATQKHYDVRICFVQNRSKLAHGCDAGVEHLRVLVGRPDNQLRRMNRTKCGDDFAHVIPSCLEQM